MGERIRPPTTDDGLTAEEVARWHADMKTLENDPRTAGGSNRPPWLVKRVLVDAKRRNDGSR